MQYKCIFIIITQRYSVALGIEGQSMSRPHANVPDVGNFHLDSESSFRLSRVPGFRGVWCCLLLGVKLVLGLQDAGGAQIRSMRLSLIDIRASIP